MSTAAKLTLAGTTAGAIGIVIFVHMQQKLDKAVSATSSSNIFTNFDRYLGYASRRDSRYGTAKDQERKTGRFRDAKTVGGAV